MAAPTFCTETVDCEPITSVDSICSHLGEPNFGQVGCKGRLAKSEVAFRHGVVFNKLVAS